MNLSYISKIFQANSRLFKLGLWLLRSTKFGTKLTDGEFCYDVGYVKQPSSLSDWMKSRSSNLTKKPNANQAAFTQEEENFNISYESSAFSSKENIIS